MQKRLFVIVLVAVGSVMLGMAAKVQRQVKVSQAQVILAETLGGVE